MRTEKKIVFHVKNPKSMLERQNARLVGFDKQLPRRVCLYQATVTCEEK